MIKGLVFDFDGLILDTEVPDFQSWQEIYREHGCDLPLATWAACIGHGWGAGPFDPYAHLEEQLGRPIARAQIQARRRQRNGALIAAQSIAPGVSAYLAAARQLGLRLGVASSSPHEWVDGHLARLGLLPAFHCVKCAGDVPRAKPDPDLYLAALDALDLHPHEAIAFEDSPTGLWAAKRAGIFAIAVPNPITAQLSLDHADLRLSSLADVPLGRLIADVDRRLAAGSGAPPA